MITIRKISVLSLLGLMFGTVNVHGSDDISAEFYASLRVGVASTKTGDDGDSVSDTVSRFSRMGIKGEDKINDKLSAFARYETEADIVNTNEDGENLRTRLGYAGVKGDWGSLRVGQDYHTFYNYNVAAGDIPWNYAGFAVVAYRGRTSETVTYQNDIGAASFGASLVLDGESADSNPENDDDVDQFELGFSYDFDVVKVAAASIIDNSEDGEDIYGLALNGGLGPVNWYVGYQEQDDLSSFTIDLTAANVYLHIEQLENDTNSSAADPTLYTLGYTLSLSDRASVWFEYADFDDDVDSSTGDQENFEVIFKYDISSKDF